MSLPQYPRLGAKFFANRFLSHMLRAGVALDYGAPAALLLTAVVLTEDKARYRRPVRFWNDNLIAYLGCRESRLISIRSKLVGAGWLYYRRGSNSAPGTYWVLVPGGDECLNDDILGDNADTDVGAKLPESAVEARSKRAESLACPPEANYSRAQFADVAEEKVETRNPTKLRPGLVENAVESAVILPITYYLNTEEEREPFEFVLKGGTSWTLAAEKLREYQTSFPGVDIEAELRTARQWCLDNATKRKTAAGMPRFLSSWLARNRKRLSVPVETRQSSAKGQADLTQVFGRDWARITPELLRSPSQVMAWFDSQTSIPDTDENRAWCLAIAKDAIGPAIENSAALFVSLGKKLTQGKRSAPGDESYDWAKMQMRLWRAHSQAKYAHQGDAEPIQLRKASELTGAFI